MENERKDIGKIVKIIAPNKAVAEIVSRGECDVCAGKATCNIFKEKNKTVEIVFDEDLKPDDIIELKVEAKNRIIASIIVFLIPLLILIGSYYLTSYFLKIESIAILISIISLLISFGLIFLITRSKRLFKSFVIYGKLIK